MNRSIQFPKRILIASLAGLLLAATASAESWRQTNGPTGLDANAFVETTDGIFVGGRTGVWRSTDGGTSWQDAATGLPAFVRVTELAADGTTVFAATFSDGVWRSDDAGATWVDVTNNMPGSQSSSIVVSNGQVFALNADINTLGLFVSDDLGASWTELPIPESFSVLFARGGTLLAAGFFNAYHSSDGGQTWTPSNSGFPIFGLTNSFAADVTSFYGLTDRDGLFRSDNAGVDWIDITPPVDPTSLFAFNTDGARGYALARQGSDAIILFTDDSGVSWTIAPDVLSGVSDGESRAIAINSAGDVLAATSRGVSRSVNGGMNWSDANDGLVGTIVTEMAGVGQSVFAVPSRGSVNGSQDQGDNWSVLNNGLPATNGEVSGLHAIDEQTLFAGTRTEGIFRSLDGGQSWSAVNTGVTTFLGSAGIQFHQVNDFAVIGNAIVAATGGGTISFGGEHGGGGFGIAADGVFRSTNNGATWQRVTSGIPLVATSQLGDQVFAAIYDIETLDNELWASMGGRGVLRSTNQGQSWTQVNGGLPSVNTILPSISGFAKLNGSVYAANESASPFRPGPGVFRFDTATNQWVASDAGLPIERRVRDIVLFDGNLIVAIEGTQPNDEVLYTSSDGANWSLMSPGVSGIPFQKFTENADGLYASTNGRGVWVLDAGLVGDVNCDGLVSVSDIAAFVLALTDPAGYAANFPTCDINNADINNDGVVSVGDIGPFVALLTGGQ